MSSNPCITLLLLIINFIFFIFALAFVIVGIHMVMDHGLILEITNGSVYLTGVYILILCGFIMLITVCIGLCGALKGDRFLLIAFIVILIILILFHFIGGILLLVFPSSMNEETKNTMRSTLFNQYGKTKLYTDAWNLTQNKLRCCGVDDLGWNIYSGSYWDNVTNIDMNNRDLRIPVSNPYYKIVPISCCWILVDYITGWPSQTYRSVKNCQYFPFGPPNLNTGAFNDAINYRGCANAMKSYMGMYARGLGGLAIFFIFVIIVGIIIAVIRLKKNNKHEKDDTMESSKYMETRQDYVDIYPGDSEKKTPYNLDEYREDEEEDEGLVSA